MAVPAALLQVPFQFAPSVKRTGAFQCRWGAVPEPQALRSQRERKLIAGLSDEDVIQMATTRTVGGDPAELARQKFEDFRLSI
jgi:hypothetical protein